MEIKLFEVGGFEAAFKAMRLPYVSGDKSDSAFNYYFGHDYYTEKVCEINSMWWIGPNDLSLAQKLIKAGDQHAKCMRGIVAWIETTGPWYWFNELDTYTVGRTPLSSTSSMHIDCKGLTGEELQKAKGEIRGDYEYTRIWSGNYQCLRHIYMQRKDHRLPEWKGFCKFIETLPLAKELICI